MGKNNEVSPAVPEAAGKLKEGTQKEKTEVESAGKEGKCKLAAIIVRFENSLYDSEGIGLTVHVEYFRIVARNKTRSMGRRKKDEGRRKKCVQIVRGWPTTVKRRQTPLEWLVAEAEQIAHFADRRHGA